MRLLPTMSTGSTGAAVTAACRDVGTSDAGTTGQIRGFSHRTRSRLSGGEWQSGRVAEWQQNRRGTSYHTGIVQVFIYLGWLSTRRRSGGLEVPPTCRPAQLTDEPNACVSAGCHEMTAKWAEWSASAGGSTPKQSQLEASRGGPGVERPGQGRLR